MKLIKLWIVPVMISLVLFMGIRPVLGQLAETEVTLADYLATNDVEVGSEVVDGFMRIYYVYNDQKNYISLQGQNSKQPSTSGGYIVWVTEIGDRPGQVYLYNITAGTTTQITYTGTNGNPKVSRDGLIVWNGWVVAPEGSGGMTGWQVFLFDGSSIKQLTSGDVSFDPEIEGDYVSYTRRDITETYRAVVYSTSRKEAKEITTGLQAKHPKVDKTGKILLSDRTQEFPLTVDDLFILELIPLTATDSARMISTEDILNELEATSSGVVETPVGTESGI